MNEFSIAILILSASVSFTLLSCYLLFSAKLLKMSLENNNFDGIGNLTADGETDEHGRLMPKPLYLPNDKSHIKSCWTRLKLALDSLYQVRISIVLWLFTTPSENIRRQRRWPRRCDRKSCCQSSRAC